MEFRLLHCPRDERFERSWDGPRNHHNEQTNQNNQPIEVKSCFGVVMDSFPLPSFLGQRKEDPGNQYQQEKEKYR